VGRYLTPFAYISILVALMVALFSQEVITILTPSSYHGAIDIVTVLSMLYGSYFFGKQKQLIFAKKTWVSAPLTLISIALNIGINIPFIMKWGAIGAAWGMLLAGMLSGTISFLVSQHFYKIKWEYKNLAYIFLPFFGFSILIILLRDLNTAYLVLLGVKIAALMIYALIGVKLRVITVENFLLIRKMILLKRATPQDHF
jgi:O-antigen/teichoic acid export membrane protein